MGSKTDIFFGSTIFVKYKRKYRFHNLQTVQNKNEKIQETLVCDNGLKGEGMGVGVCIVHIVNLFEIYQPIFHGKYRRSNSY